MPSFVAPGVYQDPLLTNVSVRYKNPKLHAEDIFPVITVPKRSGVYFKYDKENLRVPTQTTRAELSRANRTAWNQTKVSYGPLLEHSLEVGIDQDDLDQESEPLNLRVDAATLVTEKIMLEKESTLATYLNNTANVTQNVTKSGTGQWSDYVNSTPFTDVQSARSAMIANTVFPNSAWFSQPVWDQLKNHPDLLERVKYSQLAMLTEQLLATLFEVDNVWVCAAVSNTAVDGQTDSLGYLWPKSFWLGYVTPNPGIREVTGGYHLTQEGKRVIDNWYEQGVKGEFVRFTDYYQPFLIAAEALYLIKNAVA